MEIKNFGDTVHINNIGRIALLTYTANSNLTAPETLTSFQTNLVIDQGKAFNFQIDDVDAVQAKPKLLDEAMREAAYTLAENADDYLAGILTANTTNVLYATGASKPTSDTAYEWLVDAGVKLDESNIPSNDRFVVVPSWYHGLLLKDDRFVTYDKVGNVITNGAVGEAAGFKIYKSNNVPSEGVATYKLTAGHKMAATYAEQISKVVTYEQELRFNTAVKGLHLYGAKLVRDEALCTIIAERSGVTS